MHCAWSQLVDDPTEHIDLATSPEHAEIARELAQELAMLNTTLFEPIRGTPSLDACLRGVDIGRFYGPWAHVPDGWYTPLPPSTPAQQAKDDELKTVLTKLNRPLPSMLLIKCVHRTPSGAPCGIRQPSNLTTPFLAQWARLIVHLCRCRSMYVAVPIVSFKIIFPTIDTCRENGTSPTQRLQI